MGCAERAETTLRCASLGGLLFVVAHLYWGWAGWGSSAVSLPPPHGGPGPFVVPVLRLGELLDTPRQVELANGTDVEPPLWVCLVGSRTKVWVSFWLCGLLVLLTLVSLVLNCARVPVVAEIAVVAVRAIVCIPAAIFALLGAGDITAEFNEPGKQEPRHLEPIRIDTWFAAGIFLAAFVLWNSLELGFVVSRHRRRSREEELADLKEGCASDAPMQATAEPGSKATVAGAQPYNWDSVSVDAGADSHSVFYHSTYPPDELTNRTPASSDGPKTAREKTPSHAPHSADTEGETNTTLTQPITLSSSATR